MKPELTWADADWETFRAWLSHNLTNEVMSVTFTKVDGTQRVMRCSLKPELLPPAPIKESTETPRKRSDKTMQVFDLEMNAWRSFTLRNVTDIVVQK